MSDANLTGGLCCPECGCPESRVIYTRHRTFTRGDGERVSKTLRRRQCEHCGGRFLTTERVSEAAKPPAVTDM